MSSWIAAWFVSLRRLAGSNSRQAWTERLAALVVLLAALALWWLDDRLTVAGQVTAWAGLLVVVAVLLRRGWVLLIGPLVFYELLRATRRSRYALLRLYVYFMLILLVCVYCGWSLGNQPATLPGPEAGRVAQGFFYAMLAAQVILALVLVPGYVAGAVAEEKERRTLEFLLATDLRNREIILGKLLVRLASLVLMVLTGLPILALLMSLGGIDPELLVAGFAALVVTMASLAALSLLNSVYARRARDAILYTYLQALAYVFLSAVAQSVAGLPSVATLGIRWGPIDWSVAGAALWLAEANPIVAVVRVTTALATGGRLANILPPLLASYAMGHACLAVLFTAWASLRLRAVFLRQTYGEMQAPNRFRPRLRPSVSGRPMLWKEVFAEAPFRFNRTGRIVVLLLILGSFAPLVYLAVTAGGQRGLRGAPKEVLVDEWARVVGAMVACLLLVAVAVRAATTITCERARQTFDSLLTTPLESDAILRAKWLGSLLSVRWGWVWLGLLWGWDAVDGAMHPGSLVLLTFAWLVYASLLVTIGLWFSMTCENSLRAVTYTLLATVALGLSFLVLPLYDVVWRHAGTLPDPFWESVTRFQLGLTPPIALGRLFVFFKAFPGVGTVLSKADWEIGAGVGGLVCWVVASMVFWTVASWRFRVLTGRQAWRRPEAPPERLAAPRALAATND